MLKSTEEDGRYRTSVVVRRYGEAIFPVDVLVTLRGRHAGTEHWDGRDRWTLSPTTGAVAGAVGAGRSRARAAARRELHEQLENADAAAGRGGDRSGR